MLRAGQRCPDVPSVSRRANIAEGHVSMPAAGVATRDMLTASAAAHPAQALLIGAVAPCESGQGWVPELTYAQNDQHSAASKAASHSLTRRYSAWRDRERSLEVMREPWLTTDANAVANPAKTLWLREQIF
ncbi:unnamed protein product [Effrenium voratum]|uniref:Uncharacterized protein n=1 Tax=Effrenium voratum TaxID=2562239 RepID=A0AA36MJ70_9DINO|nr:unnamed protein product [Effrenium voratum]CAJ1421835.1 unnamed protein product [Effrenium voratum]